MDRETSQLTARAVRAGKYDCHVKITWSDGDITRHPAEPDALQITVTEAYG